MDMGGGRLIRIMILVLVMVLVWKIWDYSSLPVLEPPSFNAEISKGMSSSKLQSDQEQNSVLQAPVDEEQLLQETRTTIHTLENESDTEIREEKQDLIQKGEGIVIRPITKKKKLTDKGNNSETMKIKSKKKEHEESGKLEKEKKIKEKEIEKGQKGKEVAVKPTMRIEIYYEVLCSDSRNFIMKQLTPAFEKLKDILQVGLVPYGKAKTLEENGKVTFDCQHGPRECEGNIVHACVTNIIKDEAKQIAIVHCMIDRNEQPMVVGKKCVEKHGEKWASISSCVTSDKGTSILKHMGDMTHRLKPEVTFIPTITINGSQEDQKHILLDFHKVLCKRYKGPRHPSC
ncbi:gamma-interferon-inducible lysosomal thiol reductase-like isoform X1 [Penaeus monodon]|uniref:gamma-interferon-inducible lysosomal thiol reductase-like isoform X1 n=1 Tax=Penaeus monodon TaxID=6687 RepID=UPI0018A7CABF|nr:gamma-interferon-inducible lysosomal thiol reductase-like isoform X1 [Penaeus monodon]XP_037775233.1 gamma-interferon-inducible lysosomal thiol reductase-like isoform X1 [Penaeus monodon]